MSFILTLSILDCRLDRRGEGEDYVVKRPAWGPTLVWLVCVCFIVIAYLALLFQWWPDFHPLYPLELVFGTATKWLFGL